jgi:hypothetical protein
MPFDLMESSNGLSERIASRMRKLLTVLADSHYYAEDVGTRNWDFAVAIAELRSAGLTDNDLRWLVAKGYVEHAVEVTNPGEQARSFRPAVGVAFGERECFILADRGLQLVLSGGCVAPGRADLRNGHASTSSPMAPATTTVARVGAVMVPTWDQDRQELRFGELLVKCYKVPAPNQEMILAAFEEEGWPSRIDDPLPPQLDSEPKRRLHDTINSLNRKQKNAVVRFLGDGSGQGVRWERSLALDTGRAASRFAVPDAGRPGSNGTPSRS